MAKAKSGTSFIGELWTVGFYKRNQGRVTRRLTFAALAFLVLFGLYTLSAGPLSGQREVVRFGIPMMLGAAAVWIIFRLVNYARFADFLISVQAEMDKVSWASRQELYRATIVVVVNMFLLGFLLFVFDLLWQVIFEFGGFLQI